jgi:glutamyl-tRNA reductase
MSITVCGINHKTAPLSMREKVVFSLEKLPLYLADLLTLENIQEAVILSTCNRSELYCDIDDTEKALNWFCRQHQLARDEVEPFLYVYQDQAAVSHMMHVACGIDSMVLGESQILGQMKNAFSESCAAGTVGPLFNRLFQQIFAVAKEVRTNTSIGACPVSVASAAVGLAKQITPELNTVLVVGAGDTVDLLLRYLKTHNPKRIMIVNRSLENAEVLAKKHEIESIDFSKLHEALAVADIVISATGSALPIITKTMMQSVMPQRQQAAITMLDIAVPRDVDVTVGELAAVRLYCIDDLKSIIQHNLRGREHAADKAREVIIQKTSDFMAWQKSLDLVAVTIRAYRSQVEELCQAELIKATKQLQRGDDPLQVMSLFAYSFMNKLLHTPSVQLRQAGVDGRFDILQLAQQLFAIPQSESELI